MSARIQGARTSIGPAKGGAPSEHYEDAIHQPVSLGKAVVGGRRHLFGRF
jgi:hypothetical protein